MYVDINRICNLYLCRTDGCVNHSYILVLFRYTVILICSYFLIRARVVYMYILYSHFSCFAILTVWIMTICKFSYLIFLFQNYLLQMRHSNVLVDFFISIVVIFALICIFLMSTTTFFDEVAKLCPVNVVRIEDYT